MSDGQWLFAVFATLYLLECVRWLPAPAYVLVGRGTDWQVRRPLRQLEWAGLSPQFLPWLPPPALHLVALPWVFCPCQEGLEACVEDSEIALIPWDSLAPEGDEATLHLGKGRSVRLTTPQLASEWQRRVEAWKSMSDLERAKDFLKCARASLDAKVATGCAASLTRQTRHLRRLGGVIFIWTFAVVAALYRWYGDSVEVMAAVCVLFFLLWTQAVVFWRVARRAQPAPTHRFWKALAIAFLPQHAMRAADLICRAQSMSAHPLAARELLDDAAWRKLAAAFWKQARYGQAKSAPLQLQALEAFFRQQGLATADFEEAPKQEEGSAAYCPRCLTQYRKAKGVCQDCGGVALKEWPAA